MKVVFCHHCNNENYRYPKARKAEESRISDPSFAYGSLRMTTIVCFCFVVFFAFSLIGCAGTIIKDGQNLGMASVLEPAGNSRFNDIPVPVGFAELSKDSYSFEAAGTRVGMLKYRGKATPEQLVFFYKEQMALRNWNFLNIVEYGQSLINFDKEIETCNILLQPKGGSTVITITLGPKSPGIAPKKAQKPLK